ncbi:MAG: hypothetical protein JOZ69_09500 [Myxococcales bacterium]|nr:hypothetical protein [Myxococcales bacterium]
MNVDAGPDDLFALSRDVARGSAALERWRASLAADVDEHADEAPLEAVRRVAGKTTWDELAAQRPSALDLPLRDALRRWVFALTLARIGQEDEVALVRATNEAAGVLGGEEPLQISFRQAWRAVVEARDASAAAEALAAAAAGAPAVADAARKGAARRIEAARRMGVEHPWDALVAVPRPELRAAAERLLDATEDLALAMGPEAAAGGRGAAAVLHAAVARDAGEGWPAQLTGRWLEEAFGTASGLRALPVAMPRLPSVVGAASFARALRAFGHAVRVAMAPAALPFALARAPAFVGAHRLGSVFGALPADPEWQARVLGVSPRIARRQARAIGRALLLDVRLGAARLLLGEGEGGPTRERFEELGGRLFGAELDARLRGAWPAAREDEPARFLALLESHAAAEALRERFDSDWYRNPRAWADLRATSATSAHEPADAAALPGRADAIARALEGALG